jgi:hypothetical protein
MNYDDFNIELGTVLYLDRIQSAEKQLLENGQRSKDEVQAEFLETQRRVMKQFLEFATLPATDEAITIALDHLTEGMSDGEKTALLTIRNIHNRFNADNAFEDDEEALEDAVEAAEAYLMSRLADLLEDGQ